MQTAETITINKSIPAYGVVSVNFQNSQHVFPMHYHEDIYVIGLLSGGAIYGGEKSAEHLIQKGDIFLVNPGQLHSCLPFKKEKVSYNVFYFQIEEFRKGVSEAFQTEVEFPEFNKFLTYDPAAASSIISLNNSLNAHSELDTEAKVLELFHKFGENLLIKKMKMPDLGKEPKAVLKAKEILESSLDEKINLQQVAEHAGMSKYHLVRIFKKSAGVSPHAYRTIKRVELAKSMLRKNIPLADTSIATGFADQSHFTRVFTEYTGITPKFFQKNI